MGQIESTNDLPVYADKRPSRLVSLRGYEICEDPYDGLFVPIVLLPTLQAAREQEGILFLDLLMLVEDKGNAKNARIIERLEERCGIDHTNERRRALGIPIK